MKNNIIKIVAGLFVAFLVLLGIVVAQDNDLLSPGEDFSGELEVVFLDVGQGDAILIKTPYEQTILIDGGPDNKVLNELGRNLPFFQDEIDIMILTHPHADHVVGLVEVLKRYKVKEIYATGVLHTTPDYLAWLKEIQTQDKELKIVSGPFNLELGEDLVLEFLGPLRDFNGQKVENLNNTSVVNRLVYKNKKFLFTGDAEVDQEIELLESGQDLTASVLKAGHHGSSTASTENFVKAVKPELIIISCGSDNKFGHPHLRALRLFERLGIEYLRTDQQGTITIASDGEQIIMK